MKNMECLLKQTKILAVLYFIFSVYDLLMMGLGNLLITEKIDFKCRDSAVVLPKNTSGAFYLFVYSIMILMFSLTLLYIFYIVPSKHGLVVKRNDNFYISPEISR